MTDPGKTHFVGDDCQPPHPPLRERPGDQLLKEPHTPAEWQEALDAASFFLALDSARQYGLVQGGPVVDTARCLQLLEHGRVQGFKPRELAEILA